VGDATSGELRLSFNPQLHVEFGGATVTSDAGLLLPRELDERLGLSVPKSSPPTMATSSPSATTPSSSSIRTATAWPPRFARETSPVPGGWEEVLPPIIDRLQDQQQTVVVRADAAFALRAIYEALERRGVRYAIGLPANDVLERAIEDPLVRPRGRPSHAPLVR